MVFSSLLFLFRFLPLVLLAYYAAPRKLRNAVLFLSSLIFYAWGEPVYVVLILFSSLVDYIAGRATAYFKEHGRHKRAAFSVFCSVFINLTLLGFFKYAVFFLQTVHDVFSMKVNVPELALPIGISFYTFQTMSYTIDVYRGDAKVQKNFITFGAYVALFPQLIAGPIIRYKSVAEQLDSRTESVELFYKGVVRFIMGLGKKVLLANEIGRLWNEVAAVRTDQLTTMAAWLGILAFTLQIYLDFSGYSDMAIGLGYMFGFSFPENFRYPYESRSITEFWRRWHISLGTWFKEYVYIPLGGNRKGIWRQMINIGIVWFLTGLWHGASWNFVLWGIYYGVLLILEKFLWKNILEKLPVLVGHIYTLLAVMVGWSLFSWQDMQDSAGYMRAMFFHAGAGIMNRQALYLLLSNMGFLLVGVLCSSSLVRCFIVDRWLPEGTKRKEAANLLFIIIVFVACVAMLVNSTYNPFLYFRF